MLVVNGTTREEMTKEDIAGMDVVMRSPEKVLLLREFESFLPRLAQSRT